MNTIVQVVIGIIICIIAFLSTAYFFQTNSNIYSLSENDYVGGQTYTVPVITGVLPLSHNELVISTKNPRMAEYLPLPKSINLDGGAQYSYSFWLNRTGLTSDKVDGKVLFVRGLVKKARVMVPGSTAASGGMKVLTNNYNIKSSSLQTVVKQPLVRFMSTTDNMDSPDPNKTPINNLIVEMNTLNNPNIVVNIDPNVSGNGILSSTLNNWIMITFTFQDMVDMYSKPNGVLFRAYVNDTEVMHNTISADAMRLNDGPIYILPQMNAADTGDSRQALSGNLADITYYNFALEQEDIKQIYAKSFNENSFQTPSSRNSTGQANQYYRLSLASQIERI